MSLFDDTELFSPGSPEPVRYDLPDAELIYMGAFMNKEAADNYYRDLYDNTPWKASQITIYGKVHDTPRLIAWYGDTDKTYAFSGTKLDPHPWTPALLQLKNKVEEAAGTSFNSVLLNLYRNGHDSVGWHRDNEKEFGPRPVIASVSFGETRPFHLRHKFQKEVPRLTLPLSHGSLLIMKGDTQHSWEHAIPKTTREIKPRINLTFRYIHTV
jgi:alkylated DNA repair dioxygenase AlkB